MKQSTIKQINEHLEKARKKHPEFAPGEPFQVVSLATEELGEFAKEINEYDSFQFTLKGANAMDRAKDEALDLVAVLIRFIEGD